MRRTAECASLPVFTDTNRSADDPVFADSAAGHIIDGMMTDCRANENGRQNRKAREAKHGQEQS